jgi:dihydrofolate reductase
MGLLTFATNMTLDGCCDHRAVAPDNEVFRYWTRLMHGAGGMLWGRKVYELMEDYWPAVARDPKAPRLQRDWAHKLDAQVKYVVSAKRRDFTWSNTRRVTGPLARAVRALKRRTPRGLLAGSPMLSKELDRLGLVDEYLLVVHPVVAGHGPYLFLDWRAARLRLVQTKRFESGVVALRYRRASVDRASGI